MSSSPQSPAATGSIATSSDHNGNTALDIHISHVAPAARMVPNATTYVAWVVPLPAGAAQAPQPPGEYPMQQGPGAYQQGMDNEPGASEQEAPAPAPPSEPYAQPQTRAPYGQSSGLYGNPAPQPGDAGAQGYTGPQGYTGRQNFISAQPAPDNEGAPNAQHLYQEGLPPGAGRPMIVVAIQIGNHLSGSLRTTTPYAHFELLITPEANAAVAAPTNEPVLVARVRLGTGA
jgi:hypothetical protein